MYITLILHNDGHQKAQGVKERGQAGGEGGFQDLPQRLQLGFYSKLQLGKIITKFLCSVDQYQAQEFQGEVS